MNLLRELLSISVFTVAVMLVINVIIHGVDTGHILVAITGFFVAYILWPSKRKGQRRDDNTFLDIIEFIIEFPVDFFLWVFRFITRLFRSNNSGLDIDL